jgi:ubiquinone/menaquinone biosynthesis C-methylase UbiE
MGIDLDTYREQSRETWGEMASGWEDRREWLMEITGRVNARLLEKADPQPGQIILDIAAGTGDLGLNAAERVGEEGRISSTDFASTSLAGRARPAD